MIQQWDSVCIVEAFLELKNVQDQEIQELCTVNTEENKYVKNAKEGDESEDHDEFLYSINAETICLNLYWINFNF